MLCEKERLHTPAAAYRAGRAHRMVRVMFMKGCCDCDPLALTTAVNTLAVGIAAQLDDQALAMAAAVLTQLGDTLATIAVQRGLCSPEK